MKFLLLSGALCLFSIRGSSQTAVQFKDSSHIFPDGNYFKTHFLWFTGQWNVNKNIFTTTAHRDSLLDDPPVVGGSGINLTISSSGGVTIHSKKVDGWNKKVEDGLKLLQKTEYELQAPANDAKEWSHHLNEVLQPLLTDLKDEWKEYKIDNKQLLDVNQNQQKPEEGNSLNKLATSLAGGCESIRPEYDKVMAFYQSHRHDKESDLTYPPPPAYSNKCISCDTSLQKLYHIQDSIYEEKFFKPESDMVRTCLGLMRQLSLLGTGENGSFSNNGEMNSVIEEVFYHTKDGKPGPCSFINYTQLSDVVQFLCIRMHSKARKLFKDYRKNMETARAVIKVLLSATRQNELMGLQTNDDSELAECAGLVSDELNYYFDKKLLEQHDWSQLANIPFIIGLERQRELLGAHESDLIQRLSQLLNSFHLYIEMDIKPGVEGKGYQLTHMTGKTKIAPEFNYNSDSCYRWVAVEDQPGRLGFPAKKTSQKIECNLETNEIVGPGPRPVYIGTHQYYALLYGLKMDYCNPGKDTILLSSFIAEPNPTAGTWKYPGGVVVPSGTNNVEHMFQDISVMKELAQSGKAHQQANVMKQQALQMQAKLKDIQSQMTSSRNANNLAKIHQIQDLVTKEMSMGNNENVAPILRIDFPLQIDNNDNTLHNRRYDAKAINPEIAGAIIYGYYTVKVVYERQEK